MKRYALPVSYGFSYAEVGALHGESVAQVSRRMREIRRAIEAASRSTPT